MGYCIVCENNGRETISLLDLTKMSQDDPIL